MMQMKSRGTRQTLWRAPESISGAAHPMWSMWYMWYMVHVVLSPSTQCAAALPLSQHTGLIHFRVDSVLSSPTMLPCINGCLAAAYGCACMGPTHDP